MATDLETKTAAPKYEAFVDKQLAKVRSRIRALDAGRSLLMLGVATLAYFLLSAAFDLAVKGADDAWMSLVRLGAFGIYVAVMAGFLVQLGLRLYRRINPYYAAKQLEESIPDAKNSVINWLDLKEEKLPGAIRNAVGQRAARELKQTDPDKAVNPKSNWFLGGVLGCLAVGLLVLFALGPNQFGSLLERAFAPFRKSSLNTRTQITLVRPAGGDATVPLNQRVDFHVRIEGRVPNVSQPGAPRLLFRYQQADPFVSLPLEENADGIWTAALLGDQIQNGFWYKIAAGDTETGEYQVKVQSLPQATRFEVTYHYRPYRKMGLETVHFPNQQAVLPRLKDYRGTQAHLVIRTNRVLRDTHVEVEAGGVKKDYPGEILADDPKAFYVKFTLEKRGTFRALFTSKSGEENTDRSPYQIEVLDDETPRVVLTKPGQDSAQPPNGTLEVEGSARDDIGIKSVALKLKVVEGAPGLLTKVYREGKSFQFADGTYPDALEYLDNVFLDQLKTARGEPFPLKAGMVLEYWLEATDNSDYPSKNGNVGKSKVYKLTIQDAAKPDKKQDEERKKAKEQQEKHERDQDKKNAEEEQKRKDERGGDPQNQKQQEQRNREFEKKLDELNKKEKDLSQDQKQKDDAAKKENDAAQAKGRQNEDEPAAGNKDAKSKDGTGEKKDNAQGDATAQAKDDGTKDQKKPSETKGPGDTKADPAQAKGAEKKDGQPDKGTAKDQPKEQPGQAPPGQTKTEGQKGDEKPGQCKSGGAGKGEQGEAKNSGGAAEGPPAQAKGGGAGAGDTKAENKTGAKDQQPSAQDKGAKTGPPTADSAKAPLPQGPPQGSAKGDETGPKTNPQVGKIDAPESKELTKVKEQLGQKDQVDAAKKELSRLAKEAKDPEVRKAAEELLDKLGKNQGPEPNVKDTKGPPQSAAKDNPQEGPQDNAKAGTPKEADSQAKGTEQGDKETKAEVKNAGGFGPDGKGVDDNIAKQPPNADLTKRGGDLQLEDLKKRMTPETLKKLGWTEKDWQQFLKDAQAYQDSLRRDQANANKLNQKADKSHIGNTALRPIDLSPSQQVDPLQSGQAPPPPEFRDAQRQFTNPTGTKN